MKNTGFEYEPGPDGRITWFVNDTASWRILASAIGPNQQTGIGQRLIATEPLVSNLLTLNFFLSSLCSRPVLFRPRVSLSLPRTVYQLEPRHLESVPDSELGQLDVPCCLENRVEFRRSLLPFEGSTSRLLPPLPPLVSLGADRSSISFSESYIRVYQKGSPKIGCDPPDHRKFFTPNNHFPHSVSV